MITDGRQLKYCSEGPELDTPTLILAFKTKEQFVKNLPI